MKTKSISKMLLTVGLVFLLGSAITQVRGGENNLQGPDLPALPIITIHSTGDVSRGQTGSFVLDIRPVPMVGGVYVNFTVSGTAIPGVDYVPLVSPTFIGNSGYGVILIKTLPDRRASSNRQSYSVVVTLEAGLGYALGQPQSAKMIISEGAANH